MTDKPSVFVRLASQDELSTVESHVLASRAEASQYRGSVQSSPTAQWDVVLVAGLGNTIMGSACVSIESNKALIATIFVVPEAREIGLGDALLSQLVEELRHRAVTYVSAQALPGDRATKNLFERHGLIAQTIIVGKEI